MAKNCIKALFEIKRRYIKKTICIKFHVRPSEKAWHQCMSESQCKGVSVCTKKEE